MVKSETVEVDVSAYLLHRATSPVVIFGFRRVVKVPGRWLGTSGCNPRSHFIFLLEIMGVASSSELLLLDQSGSRITNPIFLNRVRPLWRTLLLSARFDVVGLYLLWMRISSRRRIGRLFSQCGRNIVTIVA
jgi:hypothetical protein